VLLRFVESCVARQNVQAAWEVLRCAARLASAEPGWARASKGGVEAALDAVERAGGGRLTLLSAAEWRAAFLRGEKSTD
jgi:hypothetical protein